MERNLKKMNKKVDNKKVERIKDKNFLRSPSPLVKSGIKKYEVSDFFGAEADFEEALTKSCTDHYAYFCLGNLKYEEGEEFAAIENYTKAIQINFDEEYYLIYLEAIKRENLKDYKGSIDYFSKAIEIYPNDYLAYLFRGNLKFYELEDFNGALSDYLKSIDINPFNINALKVCAECLRKLEVFEKSIIFYTRAIDVLSKYPKEKDVTFFTEIESRLFKDRSTVKRESGDLKGLIDDMDKAVLLKPNAHWSRHWKNRFRKRFVVDYLKKSL